MRQTWAAPALFACAIVSGCASLWSDRSLDQANLDGARFDDGAPPVRAPSGLVRLCDDAPEICAPATAEALNPSKTPGREIHSSDAGAQTQIVYAGDVWRLLMTVNSDVNWLITPRTDEENYGRREVWALPLSYPDRWRRRGGDCEDYALEKRERLLGAGLPRAALQLAVGVSPETGRHTVLIVRTDRGDVVLDNLSPMPLALDEAPYRWLSRQNGPSLLDWVAIESPPAPTSLALDVSQQPARLRPASAGARPEALLAGFEPVSRMDLSDID